MIKYWQSVHDYQCFFNDSKATFDSSERIRLRFDLFDVRKKVFLLDTDRAMLFLEPLYPAFGRPALNQPQILRSFVLLFLLVSKGLAKPSLTLWVERLKHDRVLATLVGCPTNALPPLGSYYDFMDRLWDAPDLGLYSRSKLLPASWNSKKPQKPKAKGQKASERRPGVTDVIARRILDSKEVPFNFEGTLQRLFYLVAVLPSLQSGVIPSKDLTVSGDGTAVHTHASPRGSHPFPREHYASDEEFHNAKRHFSDPDASWGWDSDLGVFYFGHTLFHLSCHNPKLHCDLPLLLRFTSAKRHDSVSFLVAFREMERHMPSIPVRNMCLDSAMDNLPTYSLLKDRGIRAFIDLNDNRGRQKTIPGNVSVNELGTPVCPAGLCMSPNGYDKASAQLMWRCPYGKEHSDKCAIDCSPAKYGRVVKTKTEWDIRLFTEVPRGTQAYKDVYKQRTATERVNNRILNDYGLQDLMIHNKKHYSFMTTMIGICIHLDARHKQLPAAE